MADLVPPGGMIRDARRVNGILIVPAFYAVPGSVIAQSKSLLRLSESPNRDVPLVCVTVPAVNEHLLLDTGLNEVPGVTPFVETKPLPASLIRFSVPLPGSNRPGYPGFPTTPALTSMVAKQMLERPLVWLNVVVNVTDDPAPEGEGTAAFSAGYSESRRSVFRLLSVVL